MREFTSLLLAVSLLSVATISTPHGIAQPTPVAKSVPTSPATRPISWTTERVAIFKDGYGLVVKSAKVSVRERTRFSSDDVPDAAVLGCFWASADGASVTGMTAQWIEETSSRARDGSCLSVLDLLRANRGKQVTLGQASPQPPINGTVLEILEEPAPKRPESARQPADSSLEALVRIRTLPGERTPHEGQPSEGETVRGIEPIGGTFVVIATSDKSRIAFPIGQIASVTANDLVTRTTRHEEVVKRSKRLTIDVQPTNPASSQAPDETTLRLFYFTPGVRWIPTYRVSTATADSTDAELALQGEILNELEDLRGAKVDLVVGVPHFRFKGVISPLSLEPVLRSSLSQAAPQLMGQCNQFSNAMFSQRASEFTSGNTPGDGNDVLSDVIESSAIDATGSGGGQTDDLFVYPIDSFDLNEGGRATIPLWTAKSPVRHIYTMDLAIVRDKQASSGEDFSYGRSSRMTSGNQIGGPIAQSPLELADGRIWHQLELKNNTNVPWTTGAAMLLRGTLPLGQDLLTYTPVHGTTRLPVTVAIDVQGSYKEEEISREPNVMQWNGYAYSKVKKRATIKVSNYRRASSETIVHLCLGGKVTTASESGEIIINDYRTQDWNQSGNDYRPNNHSDVDWKCSLEPGKSKEFVVEFEMYVR